MAASMTFMENKEPLPRISFTLPEDIQAHLGRVKKKNKLRSWQQAFEACVRSHVFLQKAHDLARKQESE